MKRFLHGGNIEEVFRTFGKAQSDLVDFSSNVSPFMSSRKIKELFCGGLKNISKYPDAENLELRRSVAERRNISVENVAVGNGAADLIYRIVFALKPKKGLIVAPTFSEYARALNCIGAKADFFKASTEDDFNVSIDGLIRHVNGHEIVFLCNPNNPTGQMLCRRDLKVLWKELRDKKARLVVDESFIDWCEDESIVRDAARSEDLVVVRSMTKFFGLAGLRLGYIVGEKGVVRKVHECGQPWPVNVVAQTVGVGLLQDVELAVKSRKLLITERDYLYRQLCQLRGLNVYPTQANFIFVKIKTGPSSTELQSALIKRGILIRDCANFYGLNDHYFRVSVRNRKDNTHLISALKKISDKEM